MKFEREIAIAFGIAFSSISMILFVYTLLTNGNPVWVPVFIAFAIVGGTMIHGKAIWKGS